MLAEVTQSATAAEKVKASVQKVKDKAQNIVDEINVEKEYAEGKLEAAKPALLEAERALQVNTLGLKNQQMYNCDLHETVLDYVSMISVEVITEN